jgi:hypothetical protein
VAASDSPLESSDNATDVQRYRQIAKTINDEITLDGIAAIIAGLEVEKQALHPTGAIAVGALISV